MWIHLWIYIYTQTYLYDIHTLGARPSDGSMYICSAHLFCIIYMYIYVNLFNCVYI